MAEREVGQVGGLFNHGLERGPCFVQQLFVTENLPGAQSGESDASRTMTPEDWKARILRAKIRPIMLHGIKAAPLVAKRLEGRRAKLIFPCRVVELEQSPRDSGCAVRKSSQIS